VVDRDRRQHIEHGRIQATQETLGQVHPHRGRITN
jgi:hypothetical protein